MFTARVMQGMALLDTVRPGWDEEINLATLDLQDYWYCILGQLYGSYTHGRFVLFYSKDVNMVDVSIAHGFSLSDLDFMIYLTTRRSGTSFSQAVSQVYDELTETWRLAIATRRAKKCSIATQNAPVNETLDREYVCVV